MTDDQQREAVARALFDHEAEPATTEDGDRMWANLVRLYGDDTAWHRAAIAALAALVPVQPDGKLDPAKHQSWCRGVLTGGACDCAIPTPVQPDPSERAALIEAICAPRAKIPGVEGLLYGDANQTLPIYDPTDEYVEPLADAILAAGFRRVQPDPLRAGVEALHKPVEVPVSEHYYCDPQECDRAGEDDEMRKVCDADGDDWPCVTFALLAETEVPR